MGEEGTERDGWVVMGIWFFCFERRGGAWGVGKKREEQEKGEGWLEKCGMGWKAERGKGYGTVEGGESGEGPF